MTTDKTKSFMTIFGNFKPLASIFTIFYDLYLLTSTPKRFSDPTKFYFSPPSCNFVTSVTFRLFK